MKLAQKLAVFYIRAKLALISRFSPDLAASRAFKLFCTPPTRDLPPLPNLFKEAETLSFRSGEYDIIGYRWNKGGTRKVLIIHGFESTVVNFHQYIEPLMAKGYEVLAFDAPAHGRSSGKQITLIDYADLVKYVNLHYGPVQSYMAHSFGGSALALALSEIEHDDSFRAVFIAPASETATAIDNFFVFLRLNNKVRVSFDKLVEAKGGHPVDWFSIDRTMPSIKAQILWLHDEGDTVTPLRDALKVKEKNYSNTRFVITNGLGHSRIYRDENVIRQVTAFL